MIVLNAGPLLREHGYTLPGPVAAAPRLFTASLVRLPPRTSGMHATLSPFSSPEVLSLSV
jgi:hypothetical protein